MRVVQACRFELDPNVSQRAALAKHLGAARFAYNWGLNWCLEALKQGERIPTAFELHKEWNRRKRTNTGLVGGGLRMRPHEALKALERAFRNRRQGRA